MTFDLRLARPADYPADHCVGLDTNVTTSKDFGDDLDLVEVGIGKTIPQGGLMVYLFRRFGYPNIGWDNHKELCAYLLTTAHPGMLMRISPYAGGDSSISIRFLVPMEVSIDARNWASKDRDAWHADLLDWIEKDTEMPDWMEGYIEELRARAPQQARADITWHSAFDGLAVLAWRAQRDGTDDPRAGWHEAMIATYEQMVPRPGLRYRDPDWTAWEDDDPLKPYARAIMQTLDELKRPVWVRDVAITPRGPVSDERARQIEDEIDGITPDTLGDEQDEDALDEARAEAADARRARAAGFPSGDLGNIDPALFARLHKAILQAGGGDAAAGMEQAIAALESVPAGS